MDTDSLTPTENLIAEVLIARYRLGEVSWSFNSRHRQALTRLEERGFVNFKDAPVEHTLLVWLTDEGKAHWLARNYEAPFGADSKKFSKRARQLSKEAKKLAKKFGL